MYSICIMLFMLALGGMLFFDISHFDFIEAQINAD